MNGRVGHGSKSCRNNTLRYLDKGIFWTRGGGTGEPLAGGGCLELHPGATAPPFPRLWSNGLCVTVPSHNWGDMAKVKVSFPPPLLRYGIQMRVHDHYRQVQKRRAKQKSKKKALQ